MNFDKYQKTTKKWPRADFPKEQRDALREEFNVEGSRLYELFKKDVLEDVGLTNHPKADKAFALAWEYGHASGYSDVYIYLCDLADLLKD